MNSILLNVQYNTIIYIFNKKRKPESDIEKGVY